MKTSQAKLGLHRGSRFALAVAGVVALSSLAACGGGGDAAEKPKENKIAVSEVPSYYPADYSSVLDASKKEGGELTIYSNTSEENWAPIFRDFQKKFPWVKKVSANDLDSDEVFQKVLSEHATGSSPVDLIVSNAASAWAEFAQRPDVLEAYKPAELAEMPDAQLLPNVYAMSKDPMTIAYNTSLMDKAPTSIHDLAEMVKADPKKFENKITVRDPESSFGFSVTKAFTDANPQAWTDFETLLPAARPETSSGTQLEKITSGEYVAGFFISGGPAFPVVDDSDGLVQVTYPSDGTSVLPRGVGIAADAPDPATAKLFVDFVLSEEGQRAVAEGGLSSYREGISGPGLHTYQELVSKVGQDKVIPVKYEVVSKEDSTAWLDKFNALVKQ
ncbi:extracellular solute-binding protein [Nocardioides sp. CER19]|uniref:ABC transporter substrate-binding protein n=1 Tax=Nocardioides sp. CER19 TaxID=3038538 RepID=UPI002448887A|nr:extracellular solute-binding protein [Nocardioides sp. CER19]MDH2416102.1 extracellular solute-binding protein [Nocardioides sp. CER19]